MKQPDLIDSGQNEEVIVDSNLRPLQQIFLCRA